MSPESVAGRNMKMNRMQRFAAILLITAAIPVVGLRAAQEHPDSDPASIDKAAVATISIAGYPDWLEIGFGSVWVSNDRVNAVQRIDTRTNEIVATVKVNEPCAAMAAGFGSMWVASCKDKSIVRINARSNKVVAAIPIAVADSEASLAAGEGGLWVLSDKKGVLSRISPRTNRVIRRISVKPNSFAAMTGFGSVWITNTGEHGSSDNGSVQRIDPRRNRVIATIPVRSQPRFFAVGEGGVWVLNQKDGSVSRINPRTNKVVATIEAGVPGTGGDIAVGEGYVWVRTTKILLSVIDPKTNAVVKRFGPKQGSGAVRAGRGAVWVSAHDVNKVWRLNPR